MKTKYGRIEGTTISEIFKTLSKKNQDYINDFVGVKEGSITPKRLLMIKNSLIKFADLLELDFDKATRDDITKAWNIIYDKEKCLLSVKSKQDDFMHIRQGFKRWFGGIDEEMPSIVKGMKRPKQGDKLKLQKVMPTEKDIHDAIKLCRNSRDKFWIAWTGLDSAIRPIENRNLKFSDLQKDKNGYSIVIKTAKGSGDREDRTIRIINSEPYLFQWMREYPGDTKDGENYIFCQLDNPKVPLGDGAITSLFRRLRKRMKLEIPFHAYTLRHALLTRLSANPKVSMPILRTMAGHSKSSTIISEYQHFKDPDIENMQREVAGEKIKKVNYELKEKPIKCPHCKTSNAFDSEICGKCNFALSQERLIDNEDLRKKIDTMAEILKSMTDLNSPPVKIPKEMWEDLKTKNNK